MSEDVVLGSEDFYRGVLEKNKDKIRQSVEETFLEQIQNDFKYRMPEAVRKSVDEFISSEIVPIIQAQLQKDKDKIAKAATEAAVTIAMEVGKAIQTQAADNLTKSWNIKKIIEGVLG